MNFIGRGLAAWLTRPVPAQSTSPPNDLEQLAAALRPGDVLLVEGGTRVSVAIKYLTQSTWSHAALYVGPQPADEVQRSRDPLCCVEADIIEGVRLVGLSEYAGLHCRICQPVGIRAEDLESLLNYAMERLGQRYDLKNVVDLARYLIPTPPVPVRWRRRMLSFGSGDPTRAICSTLIAQCFQSIRYPILPRVEEKLSADPDCPTCTEEVLRMRHYSLFVPRDFDVSPYFEIVKPSLKDGFDYKEISWADAGATHQAAIESAGSGTEAKGLGDG